MNWLLICRQIALDKMIDMTGNSNSLRRAIGAPIGVLTGALNVLMQHGYDTDAIFAICRIDPKLLGNASNRITTEQYYSFNKYLIKNTKIEGLGLLQGSAELLTNYGPTGYAVISSENLEAALQVMYKYTALGGPNLDFQSEIRDNHLAMIYEYAAKPLPIEWCVEDAFASFAAGVRQCLPGAARFNSVQIGYPAPSYAAMYEEMFECPVEFGATTSELRIPLDLLNVPFHSHNPNLWQFCIRECDQILDGFKSKDRVVDQVEAVIRSSSGAIPLFPVVAETLFMSPRTLHRRLTKEGVTYRQLVENLRKRLAREYLVETRLEQKEVAYLLGYTEPANFYHAFQRWFGCTPTEFLESASD